MKTILKLQIWLIDKNDEGRFEDFYFDVERIDGFYIPEKQDDITEDSECINILFSGDMISIKQEQNIKQYLLEEFIQKSK